VEPNDFGLPQGIFTHCSGTLIRERVFLVAGHCTAPAAGGLLVFIKAFVTLSPNALDRTTWRPLSHLAFHPSLPPCPPPEGCTFRGLDPGILDIGLVLLSRPVRDIAPAKLAKPGTRFGALRVYQGTPANVPSAYFGSRLSQSSRCSAPR